MNVSKRFSLAAALACGLVLTAGWVPKAPAQDPTQQEAPQQEPPAFPNNQQQAPAKQGMAIAHGVVTDSEGKPFKDITIDFKNTATGMTYDATTDGQGKYNRPALPTGNYTISLLQGRDVMHQENAVLSVGQTATINFDFKELKAKEAADAAATEKANAEAKAKFAAMKTHFDAGLTALQAEKDAKATLDKAPKAQQPGMQASVDTPATTATTELQAAVDGTAANDPNRAVVLSRLGDAWETDSKWDKAADAYSQSLALKPDAGIYNNLGNCLAKSGKVADAKVAYDKASTMDPMNTAVYQRNFGISLQNSNQMKDSIEPLQKATAADPNNAQGWYLLGQALVSAMEYKTQGDKDIVVIQPGTVEAYQKAIQLDPNGPYGAQAKEGLAVLQSLGAGIDTKLSQPSTAKDKGKK